MKRLIVLIAIVTLHIPMQSSARAETAAPGAERVVTIVALQAGRAHFQDGNPGPEANFAVFARLAREAASVRPDLIVFPEYALSGWPYPPEARIHALAETIPGEGPWYRGFVALAKETGVAILGNMIESDGGRLYNTAFLVAPDGHFIGKYRKVHANLGEQTWWGFAQGDSLAPIAYDGVRYGVSICSDMWFPETIRCASLLGADVILHQSIGDDMEHIVPTRAFDSAVPIVMAIFQGGCYAVDADGKRIEKADADSPAWKAFRLRPFEIRTHNRYGGRWIPKQGNLNLRNVNAYGILTNPATRVPWTRVFLDGEQRPQTRAQLLARFNGRYDANDPAPYHEPLVAFDAPWTSPHTIDPRRPFHLINRDGRHLFIVNKTAWAYFGCKDPAGFLDRARAQGINVIRVALEGRPYFKELNIELWPWGGTREKPDWSIFNDAYWEEVERRVRLAGEKGIGLDIVLNTELHPESRDIDAQRPYWEETLRRLGKYANVLTWEIANEYTANEAFQDAAGAFFKARDPYGRPVCTSDGTTDDAVWPDKPWIDLAINHTCTSSRHDLRDWYLALARNTRAHGKPAFCNESGREKRHGNDDGVHRRKQGWLWCAAGGFWTYHSWEGCEGIDDPDYRGPGQEFMKPLADFFQALPFWTLEPNYTSLRLEDPALISAALADAARSTVVAYVCAPRTGASVAGAAASLRLPEGRYRLAFLAPANLAAIETRELRSPGTHEALPAPLPEFTDDLVLRVERIP